MIGLEQVSFGYGEKQETLSQVSATAARGECVLLCGASGCGKTTTLRIIGGFETPDKGKVIFDGQDITDMSITDRAKLGISYAFQQPVRFKGVTVFDLLRLAAGKEISVAGACEYLSKVGLCAKDYIRREVNGSLSGGEIKRIEIATILARKTRVSVFDEPEAGIDLWSFQNLIQVFEEMHEQLHGSILIISHQERILNIADQIILIADGKLVKKGTKEEVLPELLGTANAAPSCDKAANRK